MLEALLAIYGGMFLLVTLMFGFILVTGDFNPAPALIAGIFWPLALVALIVWALLSGADEQARIDARKRDGSFYE